MSKSVHYWHCNVDVYSFVKEAVDSNRYIHPLLEIQAAEGARGTICGAISTSL